MDIKEVLRKHTLWLEQSFSGEKADLSHMDCRGVNLSRTDLTHACLLSANLKDANLTGTKLIYADLRRANLAGANLSGANLSGCVGLVDPTDYIDDHFEKSPHGYIVYKVFGGIYRVPEYWEIEQNSIIAETVDFDRCCDCGCGINVATLDWIKQNFMNEEIWKCLIEWPWLAGVCVPYNTDGKIRASKIRLLEIVQR